MQAVQITVIRTDTTGTDQPGKARIAHRRKRESIGYRMNLHYTRLRQERSCGEEEKRRVEKKPGRWGKNGGALRVGGIAEALVVCSRNSQCERKAKD
jgi:hypothetical protein